MAADTEDPIPDEVLLARAGTGDAGALDALFARHLPALEQRARRVIPANVRRRASVSDVVQEARLVALRRAPEFEAAPGAAPCLNWLLTIVEYKAREALRAHAGAAKRDVRREVARGARPDTQEFPGATRSPSAHAMAAEARGIVEAALGSLPDDYRDVLRRTRLEGRSLAEVATISGRSREAVKKLYARALARFTEALQRARVASRE